MVIKLAMVGLGYWGPNLARAFAETPGCELSVLVDSDVKRLDKFARAYPNARRVATLAEALAEKIDAVVLATPAETHAPLGLQVLASGHDLFVEKPIALTDEDASSLVEAAGVGNRILMVGHLLLYHPAYQDIRRRLDAGEFGTLRYLYSRRVNLGIVRSHENALWSLAPHDIAVSDWLIGASPTRVQAVGTCYLQNGVEDVVFYTLSYSDDVIFHGHVSWLDPQKVRELSVIGTDRMAVIDDTQASDKVRIYDRKVETQRQAFTSYGQFLSIRTGDVLLPHIAATEPLKLEAAHFVECVRERKNPISDGASGLAAVRTLNALTRSLKGGGGWVALAFCLALAVSTLGCTAGGEARANRPNDPVATQRNADETAILASIDAMTNALELENSFEFIEHVSDRYDPSKFDLKARVDAGLGDYMGYAYHIRPTRMNVDGDIAIAIVEWRLGRNHRQTGEIQWLNGQAELHFSRENGVWKLAAQYGDPLFDR